MGGWFTPGPAGLLPPALFAFAFLRLVIIAQATKKMTTPIRKTPNTLPAMVTTTTTKFILTGEIVVTGYGGKEM